MQNLNKKLEILQTDDQHICELIPVISFEIPSEITWHKLKYEIIIKSYQKFYKFSTCIKSFTIDQEFYRFENDIKL